MKKEYFCSRTEFLCGVGEVFTEFIDDVAIRQVNRPDNGVAYASSSLHDWNSDIGFLLFDGLRGELDISPGDEIDQEDFERAWKAAVDNL